MYRKDNFYLCNNKRKTRSLDLHTSKNSTGLESAKRLKRLRLSFCNWKTKLAQSSLGFF